MTDRHPTPSTSLTSYPDPARWDDVELYDPRTWPTPVTRHFQLVPTTCFNCEANGGRLAWIDKDNGEIAKFEGNPTIPPAAATTAPRAGRHHDLTEITGHMPFIGDGSLGVEVDGTAQVGVDGLTRGRALDVACGEGRNAIWLAERGWSVTGVDFSPLHSTRRADWSRHGACTSTGSSPTSPTTHPHASSSTS